MLVDSHCHLDYADPETRAGIVARARRAGIGTMVTIGTKFAEPFYTHETLGFGGLDQLI